MNNLIFLVPAVMTILLVWATVGVMRDSGLLDAIWPRKVSRPPGKIQPVDPWPAPPELSCFVRGLIKSMKETPDQWHRQPFMGFHTVTWLSGDLKIGQSQTPYSTDPKIEPVDVVGHSLTAYERKMLTVTWQTLLEGPYQDGVKAVMEKDREERARVQAAVRASFEKLGCPTDSAN